MANLVIVMAGDGSIHENYAFDRDFELWVCYWGDDDNIAKRFGESCDRLFRLKGQKWELVRELGRIAREQGSSDFSRYEYVFLPDDDIEFNAGAADISNAFALARKIKADIFQPAIANEHYSWETTLRIAGVSCHATTLVEIMMPAFSGEIFERCVLPLLHIQGYLTAGWGMEPLIVRFAETIHRRAIRCFVLDLIPANHTRPVGTGSSAYSVGMDEAFINPFFYGLNIKELERFQTWQDAKRYEFPVTDEVINWRAVKKQLRRIRMARQVYEMDRQKNFTSSIRKGIQKLAARVRAY